MKLYRVFFFVIVTVWLAFQTDETNLQLKKLEIQIQDNYALIEDLQTQLDNIDPVSSLISQGEESEPGHHVFQYIESGNMMTGVVVDLSLIDTDELLLGN